MFPFVIRFGLPMTLNHNDKAYKVNPPLIPPNGHGVTGDWRLEKDRIQYEPFTLPDKISDSCIEFQKKLGLTFGAIDLIESGGKFYFIEINPTGEWAWLIKTANLPLDKAICDELQKD